MKTIINNFTYLIAILFVAVSCDTFETDLDVQDDSFIATGNHTLKFVEELKRINKEGPKQFDQPIIKEKAAHNKNLFEKRSNTDSLLNEIKRWFEIK